MKKLLKIKLGTIVIVLCFCIFAYSKVVYLKKFTFDENKALDKWRTMILKGKVNYILMKYGNDGYVRALSEKACSALYYRVGFNLNNYPFLSWKWRVIKFPDLSKAENKLIKDDYAARIYVVFPFLNFSLSKFLEYVWAENIPVGTVINSPYGGNVKMIVARSGMDSKGEWVSETRNIQEDYIKAFGKKPRMSVGAIAIMCDSDDTQTSAESLFDEIAIESQAGF